MMYELILSPEASEFYERADAPLAKKLARCFRQLEANPKAGSNVKRLTGEWKGYFRYRVGSWRVIYRVDDDDVVVIVAVIGHRRDIYE